jgi:hypothetical protein
LTNGLIARIKNINFYNTEAFIYWRQLIFLPKIPLTLFIPDESLTKKSQEKKIIPHGDRFPIWPRNHFLHQDNGIEQQRLLIP